jgi:hypothetical protein
MILETMAISAITYLGHSLLDSKGAKAAKDEATSALWSWVRPIFLKDEEKQQALQQFEAEPAKAEHQQAMIQTTQQHLQAHPEQAEQLEVLLERAQAAHPERMGDVINFGNVEKQVNNPIIKGDFNM